MKDIDGRVAALEHDNKILRIVVTGLVKELMEKGILEKPDSVVLTVDGTDDDDGGDSGPDNIFVDDTYEGWDSPDAEGARDEHIAALDIDDDEVGVAKVAMLRQLSKNAVDQFIVRGSISIEHAGMLKAAFDAEFDSEFFDVIAPPTEDSREDIDEAGLVKLEFDPETTSAEIANALFKIFFLGLKDVSHEAYLEYNMLMMVQMGMIDSLGSGGPVFETSRAV